MATHTIARQIVIDALKAEPTVASRTLARRLYEKYSKTWTTYNACCIAVRRERGAQGKYKRNAMHPTAIRSKEDAESCQQWGALLPEPHPNKWAWQTLPESVGRWLILCDIHLPFHDPEALRAVLDYAHGRCDGVLLGGDTLDCYALSRFEKDPELCDFDAELEACEGLLAALRAWGAKEIVMKGGNHEARLERYLIAKAPELLASHRVREKLTLPAFLDLEKRGVHWIDSMDPIKVGQLCILHGHEMGGGFSSPVNPARGVYLKGKECCLIGHEHRTSEHTEQSMLGTTITTWSMGCLCDLHPRYRPFNKWNSGAAILDLTGEDWKINNFRVVNGRVV